MISELSYVSNLVDQSGVKLGDTIEYKPFFSKRRNFNLNRVEIHFVTKNLTEFVVGKQYKILDNIGSEKLHFVLEEIEALTNGKERRKRFVIKSLRGGPIKLNGNYILQAYLEKGDVCELGHNRISFIRENYKNQFDSQTKLIEEQSKIINSDLPILLEGETGTGKTSLAEKVHVSSGKNGRFVHINISAYSANLLESELFGHIKGAFTGAMNDKKGAIEEARGGSLFIDEIDSLDIELQTKLLLFLDNKKIRSVGSNVEKTIDTRLIFASGQKLSKLVETKVMRKDFYYRLTSGHTFYLDSLRDNTDLIEKFCELYSISNNIVVSKKLISFYKTLPWPGNYRQLHSHVEKKKVLSNSRKIDFDQLDESLLQESSELFDISRKVSVMTLEDMKVAYARKIYYECDQVMGRSASRLAISNRSLKRLLDNNDDNFVETGT